MIVLLFNFFHLRYIPYKFKNNRINYLINYLINLIYLLNYKI